jgi:hypothetical protein
MKELLTLAGLHTYLQLDLCCKSCTLPAHCTYRLSSTAVMQTCPVIRSCCARSARTQVALVGGSKVALSLYQLACAFLLTCLKHVGSQLIPHICCCHICSCLAVPVKLFANFRKVRALTRDAACISEALKDSKELVLSEDGKRVSAPAGGGGCAWFRGLPPALHT